MRTVCQSAPTSVFVNGVLYLQDSYSLGDVGIESTTMFERIQPRCDDVAHSVTVVEIFCKRNAVRSVDADDVFVILVIEFENRSFRADESEEVIARPAS